MAACSNYGGAGNGVCFAHQPVGYYNFFH